MNGSISPTTQRVEQAWETRMTSRIPRLLAALALVLLVGCDTTVPQVSSSSESIPQPGRDFESGASLVLVDQSEPAFIVFTGIPKDTDEATLEEIRSTVSTEDKVNLLTWEQFTDNVDSYAQAMVVINDYPDVSVVDGLVCLVGKAPGAPWGLTWNGGIALTNNDYRHTIEGYQVYKSNPDAYSPDGDPGADPVNPGGHLPAFGCMY